MATIEHKSATGLSKPTTSPEVITVTPPVTPNPTSIAAHELVSEMADIYSTLRNLPSLAPSHQVNILLTRLVDLCIPSYSAEFTSYFFNIPSVKSLCTKLRPLCSEAEGELESYWAERMLHNLNSSKQQQLANTILKTFPYHKNYIDLSRLECSIISAFLPTPPKKIAFIGSGPLPLTSLCFLDRYPSAVVYNIDRDAVALHTSQALCQKLGAVQMRFLCQDVSVAEPASADEDWANSEVVFLAALVGADTHAKLGILVSLSSKLRPGALVVVRSARGVRSVLYPVLELSDELQASGFDVLAEVHPWTEVVNSVVVLRVRER
ncbi:Nicotianamine synthase [Decorospora gaudefroyi]|uniref:Nicotianamine synthase n=1 Tax=Decorospora gaudefroyi TaxID=184978 RepID=A0A6A5KN17_9PLEO|nr:Nicotianamine synthase [Decorospora gaudefroyi]